MIKIQLPNMNELLKKGVDVKISPIGEKWSELDLGDERKEIGVYVIHHNKQVKYVGKTSGKKMSFGIRLRRHFQEKAAGKHTYPRLANLQTPPSIKVSMITLAEVEKYITHNIEKPSVVELIPLFEAALIVGLKPEFQQ